MGRRTHTVWGHSLAAVHGKNSLILKGGSGTSVALTCGKRSPGQTLLPFATALKWSMAAHIFHLNTLLRWKATAATTCFCRSDLHSPLQCMLPLVIRFVDMGVFLCSC